MTLQHQAAAVRFWLAEKALKAAQRRVSRFTLPDRPTNAQIFDYTQAVHALKRAWATLHSAKLNLKKAAAVKHRTIGGTLNRPRAAAKKKAPRKAKQTRFEQLVEERMDHAAHVLQGHGGRTGRAMFGRENEVIGRFKGYGKEIPELMSVAAPAQIVDALHRGKGWLYENIKWAIENAIIKKFPQYSPRQRGLVAEPHTSVRKCKICRKPHSATAHRSHGPGAFLYRGERVTPWMRAGGAIRAPEEMPEWVRENPRRVEIYPKTRNIMISGMKKGPGHPCDARCRATGHRFRHRFTENVAIIGNADGTVTLREAIAR